MEQLFTHVGIIDIVCAIFLLLGLVRGFMKGFGRELAKNLVLLLSVGTSLTTYEMGAKLLYENSMIAPTIAEFSVCLAVAFFTSFIFKFLLYVVSRIISFQFAYIIERTLGLFLGGFRYAFFFCYITYLAILFPAPQVHDFIDQGKFVTPVITQAIPVIKGYTDPARDLLLARYGLTLESQDTPSTTPESAPLAE